MTAPYSPTIPDLAPTRLAHHVTVTAHPAGAPDIALAVDRDDLEITMSKNWAPRIQARMTCSLPASVGALDALDPRLNTRVTIAAGYLLADGPDMATLANLYLEARPVARPNNTVEISAASAETRAMDSRIRWATAANRNGAAEAITQLIQLAMSPIVPVIVSKIPAAYKKSMFAELAYEIGDEVFDLLEDVASSADLVVYCDADNRWIIDYRTTTTKTPKATIKTGNGGTAKETESDLSRADWYNDVVIRYRWKNGTAEQDIVGRASVTSGPYRVAVVGRKTYFESKGTGTTQTRANDAARAKLGTLATRGRMLRVTAANAYYWLRPSDTVEISIAGGDLTPYIVSAVTFRPVAGSMTLTLREPLTATITAGE